MEEIKLRIIGDGWAYVCPRCLYGTMSWEQDEANAPRYLKCIICGKEVRQEFEKTEENVQKKLESESSAEKISGNKHEKKAIKSSKWQFGRR